MMGNSIKQIYFQGTLTKKETKIAGPIHGRQSRRLRSFSFKGLERKNDEVNEGEEMGN